MSWGTGPPFRWKAGANRAMCIKAVIAQGTNPWVVIRDRRRYSGVGLIRSPGRDLDPCLPLVRRVC
jgi:hypothetical protein